MDQERQRVEADLRGLLDGDILCDDVFLQMYACDASIYEIRPLGVVRPRGVADVVATVQYAAEHNLPVHARGAGTGLAGESLGAGLVIDFSHYMRRIISIADDQARVQPGVIHATLNRQLLRVNRQFGPDPSTRSVTTMGSVLSLDGSGSHWMRYGSARSHIISMQVVLADGEVMEISRHQVHDPHEATAHPRRAELTQKVSKLITRSTAVLKNHQPKTAVNRSGYHLYDVLEDGKLDLAKMLVGSEGTLALITEATVHTDPVAAHRGMALLFFDRLDWAARAAVEIPAMNAAACDLMDRRLLTIARETDPRYEKIIPASAEAMLLVELQDDNENDLRARMHQLVNRIQRRRRLAFDSRVTLEDAERNLYWRIARRVVPTLYQLKGSTRPIPFVEDIAIPPQILPAFLVRVQNVLKSHKLTASLFAHAGHGQLHLRPFIDLSNPRDVARMHDFAIDLYNEVIQAGGTISGEHGDGLSRTWYAEQQHGPLYGVFRRLKEIFDPAGILNPGKVIDSNPQKVHHNLRRTSQLYFAQKSGVSPGGAGRMEDQQSQETAGNTAPQPSPKQNLEPLLIWQGDELSYATRSCNGCGRCRTQSPMERMCPVFRVAPAEEASPRAKANLLRGVLTGALPAEELSGDTLKALADLCVNCHQCRLECPASVDIPKIALEAKAQYVATNGLHPRDWFIANLDTVARWASMIQPVANWALGNRTMRWLLEKTAGVAQGRKLPQLAPRSFMRIAHRRRLTRPTRRTGRKVVYFVDTYANWFDVSLAESLVEVLEHNGVAVFVHPGQQPSGMTSIALGSVDKARRLAQHNTRLLAEAVRQGYHVIATEPAAALCLTHEYKNLIDDDDARLVAENSSEACDYLFALHQTGQLELDFRPLNATLGYHEPCHAKAINSTGSAEQLLRLIPGLNVRRVERGCSGMAGAYGLKRENYRNSLRAGWGLISEIRQPEIIAGATGCSACKMQMEQGAAKPTIHPLKMLSMSYGLAAGPEELLYQRPSELYVT